VDKRDTRLSHYAAIPCYKIVQFHKSYKITYL